MLFEFLEHGLLLLLQLLFHLAHTVLVLYLNVLVLLRAAAVAHAHATAGTTVDFAASHLGQLLTQTGDFVMELADHGVLRVLIDARFVLDLLGSRSIPQSGKRLLNVVLGRAHVGDHDCLGVATE